MEHANFSSERLQVVLITREHAAIVHPVFQDPELFTYLPNDPPELERLEKQYAFWEGREAPDGSEYWLNYALFLSSTGAFVGTLQSGFPPRDERGYNRVCDRERISGERPRY